MASLKLNHFKVLSSEWTDHGEKNMRHPNMPLLKFIVLESSRQSRVSAENETRHRFANKSFFIQLDMCDTKIKKLHYLSSELGLSVMRWWCWWWWNGLTLRIENGELNSGIKSRMVEASQLDVKWLCYLFPCLIISVTDAKCKNKSRKFTHSEFYDLVALIVLSNSILFADICCLIF